MEFEIGKKDFDVENLSAENDELKAKVCKLYEQIGMMNKSNQSSDEQSQS